MGILDTAQWWADFQPGSGNLDAWHPVPAVVECTPDAQCLIADSRAEAEAEYARAEQRGDAVGTTVWGRGIEQSRKLALDYAVSANHLSPTIDANAVRWATEFVMYQTRRMLFMAQSHAAENPFYAECLKAIEKLLKAPGQELPHSVLLKRMKMDSKSFAMLVETIAQRGDIEVLTTARPGWHVRTYRLMNLCRKTTAGGET